MSIREENKSEVKRDFIEVKCGRNPLVELQQSLSSGRDETQIDVGTHFGITPSTTTVKGCCNQRF